MRLGVVDPWTIYALAVALSIACILWRYRHSPQTGTVYLYIVAIIVLLSALALFQQYW